MKPKGNIVVQIKTDIALKFKEEIGRTIDYNKDNDLEELSQLILRRSWEWPRNHEQYGVAPSVSTLKRFFRKNSGMSAKFFYAILKYIGVEVDWMKYVRSVPESTETRMLTDKSDLMDLLVTDDLCDGDIIDVRYGKYSYTKFKLADLGGKNFSVDGSKYFEVLESSSRTLRTGDYLLIPYFIVGAPIVGIDLVSESRHISNAMYISSGEVTSFDTVVQSGSDSGR